MSLMQDVNYELFADSVKAECTFGIRAVSPEFVESTMEKLGLSPYRDKHPNTLSGGQKQRVAVAELIRELSAAGKIIFIVPHDYEFICRTCSRVFPVGHGE